MRTRYFSIICCYFIIFSFSLKDIPNFFSFGDIIQNIGFKRYSSIHNQQSSEPNFQITDLSSTPVEYATQRTVIIQFTLINASSENATNVNFLMALPNNLRIVSDWVMPSQIGPSVSLRDDRWLVQWHFLKFDAGQTTKLEIPVQVSSSQPVTTYEILSIYNSDQIPNIREAGTIIVETSEDLTIPPHISASSDTLGNVVTPAPPTSEVPILPAPPPDPPNSKRTNFWLLTSLIVGGSLVIIGVVVVLLYFNQVKKPQQINLPVTNIQTMANQEQPSLSNDQHVPRIRLVVAGNTNSGRVREFNEDSYLIREECLDNVSHSFVGLYAVADGMGGYKAGDIASKMVINTLTQQLGKKLTALKSHKDQTTFDPMSWLQDSLTLANQHVFEEHKRIGAKLGSTLVAILVLDSMAFVGHVGDSRAYLIRDKNISALTKDHSIVQELIDANKLKPEEATQHPKSGLIYRALGIKSKTKPDFSQIQLMNQDIILLCSDGLNSSVPDADILKITLESPSVNEICHRLINAANSLGGEDNITVIAILIDFS